MPVPRSGAAPRRSPSLRPRSTRAAVGCLLSSAPRGKSDLPVATLNRCRRVHPPPSLPKKESNGESVSRSLPLPPPPPTAKQRSRGARARTRARPGAACAWRHEHNQPSTVAVGSANVDATEAEGGGGGGGGRVPMRNQVRGRACRRCGRLYSTTHAVRTRPAEVGPRAALRPRPLAARSRRLSAVPTCGLGNTEVHQRFGIRRTDSLESIASIAKLVGASLTRPLT